MICLVVPYLGAHPILICNVRQSKLIKKKGVRKLDPKWFWQQDGATCHWAVAEMKLLAKYGLSPELKTIIVDETTCKWPAHSSDMSWLDEYVWGYMVTEMRFMRITNKADLRHAITKIWKTKITKKFCQDAIRSFWKGSNARGAHGGATRSVFVVATVCSTRSSAPTATGSRTSAYGRRAIPMRLSHSAT